MNIQAAIAAVGPVALPCCTYVQRVCTTAYGPEVTSRAPGSQWNLWDPAGDPWGPVNAAVACGVAPRLELEPVGRGAWHVVQGWRTEPSATGSGHTFLLFVPVRGGDAVLVADSIGPSKDHPEGRAACARPTSLTRLRAEFDHGMRFGVLLQRRGDGHAP